MIKEKTPPYAQYFQVKLDLNCQELQLVVKIKKRDLALAKI
jgi:hypothetical protein